MKKGNILVEQVTEDGIIVEDYDTSLSNTEIYDRLRLYFPKLRKADTDPVYYIGEYGNQSFAIRCKNITYLGNPHPLFKKRIQISGDLFDYYKKAIQNDASPLLLGIYTYEGNTLFVSFGIDTYIKKTAHNSSAHVYSSDLQMAVEGGFFQKTDFFGNSITVFRPDTVSVFLDDYFSEKTSLDYHSDFSSDSTYLVNFKNGVSAVVEPGAPLNEKPHLSQYSRLFRERVLPSVQRFFAEEDKNWHGIDCYKKMISSNYRNKYQPEWVGFFLEYEFEQFIDANSLENRIKYYQDKSAGGIDLDLYFPELGVFGDLKAHSEDSRGIQGNDWDTVFSIIENPESANHIFYIVCEHSTEKDSLHNYEVTQFWNAAQNKSNLMSYYKRMKNSATLKKVYILDINNSNKFFLTKFKQGVNSNGKPREPKIMIETDKLSHFVIEEIDLEGIKKNMSSFKFIDLFSGIGGFHQAMTSLGGECVFASEINPQCINVYKENYGIDSGVNIRDVVASSIPKHDVLCAGFPCQAFSKAGFQLGLEDITRGTLFFEIVRILSYHRTPYIILENVRNLVSHDSGRTWEIIQANLKALGYRTTAEPLILSPHYFGIPQIRERVIILGKHDPDNVDKPLPIKFEPFKKKEENSVYDVLDAGKVDDIYYISEYEEMVLQAWDEFYKGIDMKVIGFPIWADYFKYSGSFDGLPEWKATFIQKNQKLYADNKSFIDKWLRKYNDLADFIPTHHKMEWQCGTKIDSIWDGIIQFRPSGVRVKTPDCFQALVAMVQIPIVGKYRRRLTVTEAGRLQSFPMDSNNPFVPDSNMQQAYKQFGNAVNVEVIKKSAEELFKL